MRWLWTLFQQHNVKRRKRGDGGDDGMEGRDLSQLLETSEAKVEKMQQQLEADIPDKRTKGARTFCSWTL
jgi:hypothetical protein